MARYKSVRFFGFSRGRLFLGVCFGSKGQSKADQFSGKVCRLSKENDDLRAAIPKEKP